MKRPIYYCCVKYAIRRYRGRRQIVENFIIEKMVCKDPDSKVFKKRVLEKHFREKSNVKKLIDSFDMSNIYVRFVCVYKKLGYENEPS